MVANRLPALSPNVLDNAPNCVIIACRLAPLPFRLAAPVLTSSDSAPFLFSAFGPSAWVSRLMLV